MQATTEDERPNLAYVHRDSIIDEETKQILARVLQLNFPDNTNPGRAPNSPESRKITEEMPGFNALIETPNVRGVAWLLMQHQGLFAGKSIKSIEASSNLVDYMQSLLLTRSLLSQLGLGTSRPGLKGNQLVSLSTKLANHHRSIGGCAHKR